jgi:hypothetical protein
VQVGGVRICVTQVGGVGDEGVGDETMDLYSEIEATVGPDFYVGHQGSSGIHVPWWTAANENGSGGSPWTCIAPGVGYPTGWQHPAIVWPGRVKALYSR